MCRIQDFGPKVSIREAEETVASGDKEGAGGTLLIGVFRPRNVCFGAVVAPGGIGVTSAFPAVSTVITQ